MPEEGEAVSAIGLLTMLAVVVSAVLIGCGKSATGAQPAPGPALATFAGPNGLHHDGAGNVYVADYDAGTLRRITPAGAVTTLASIPHVANVVCNPIDGNLYATVFTAHKVVKITPDGKVSSFAGSFVGRAGSDDGTGREASFNLPNGMCVDKKTGDMYIADNGNSRIRKLTLAGVVTTVAGSTVGSDDGVGAAAKFNNPTAVAINSAGTQLAVADYLGQTIRLVKLPSAAVTTLAGSPGVAGHRDGAGRAAMFYGPNGIVFTPDDSAVIVTEFGFEMAPRDDATLMAGCTLRKVTLAGVVTTLAGKPGVRSFADGVGAAAFFKGLVAVDYLPNGNLLIADYQNQLVRQMTPDGAVTTYAGQLDMPKVGLGTVERLRDNSKETDGVARVEP